jgi:chaperonin GroEL (HSP60 family)
MRASWRNSWRSLLGVLAVIKVEGSGKVQVGKKDRYDDRLNATHAGVEKGILPKHWITLLKALLSLATKSTGGASNIPTNHFDQILAYL